MMYNHYYGLTKTGKEKPDFNYNLEEVSFNGRVCAFTGHRPSKLSFSGESDPRCIKMMSALRDEIQIAMNIGFDNFISGMALGVDQWAAMNVLDLKEKNPQIKLFSALPCLSQADKWNSWQKERYADLLKLSEDIFVISREYTNNCPNRRNAFMVKHAELLIAVFDGTPGGTANTVKMAKRKGIEVITINPNDFV